MKKTVKAVCVACAGTGVYRGFCEPNGMGAVCGDCDGSGCLKIIYEPFKKRKVIRTVKQVRLSWGKGDPIPYKDFLKGKRPRGQEG